MINFQRFVEKIEQGIQKSFGEGYCLERKYIEELNGAGRHSIQISRQGTFSCPCVNLDRCYLQYKSGADIEEIIHEAVEQCQRDFHVRFEESFDFACWENVKHYIFGKLVNTGKNQKLLGDVPNRMYWDLSLMYYVRLKRMTGTGRGTVQVTYEHMHLWDVEEETLFSEAWKNMREDEEIWFENMDNVLHPFCHVAGVKGMDADINLVANRMYLLGNKAQLFGAVQMCNGEILRKIEGFFKDDFWILPSSVHEVILFPCSASQESAEGLQRMVMEINETQVPVNEVLSDHVYRYDRKEGKVVMAV